MWMARTAVVGALRATVGRQVAKEIPEAEPEATAVRVGRVGRAARAARLVAKAVMVVVAGLGALECSMGAMLANVAGKRGQRLAGPASRTRT